MPHAMTHMPHAMTLMPHAMTLTRSVPVTPRGQAGKSQNPFGAKREVKKDISAAAEIKLWGRPLSSLLFSRGHGYMCM